MAAWLVLDNFEIGMHGTLKIVNNDASELMSFPAIIEWGPELPRGLLRRLWPIATVACRRGVCTVLTHCDTLQHTATHCNTLQHTATYCNSLQHTTTHNRLHLWHGLLRRLWLISTATAHALQHTRTSLLLPAVAGLARC